MAETDIISTANIQIASHSCTSCISSDTTGLNKSLNGNFNELLSSSIQEVSDLESGAFFPNKGKNLPQSLKDLKSSLQSVINDISIENNDFSSLSELLGDGIAENLHDIQQQFNITPEAKLTLQALSDNLLELSGAIGDTVAGKLENVSEIVDQIVDELNILPITLAEGKNASIRPVPIDSLGSIISSKESKPILDTALQLADLETSQSPLNKSITTKNNHTIYSTAQDFDIGRNASEKFGDFITNNLSQDSASGNLFKSQAIDTNVLQQSIVTIRSDQALQNSNISTIAEPYNNLNTGAVQHRVIEAPIPLLIKQGASTEQIQQNVDQSIEQNVKWLIGNKVQNAKINVFPESLGQVNIALNLEDSNLKLNFIASSAVTKDLIEASVSSLRNHFSESGIHLEEVNIETQFSNQEDQGSEFLDMNGQEDKQFKSDSIDNIAEVDDLLSHKSFNANAVVRLLDAYA